MIMANKDYQILIVNQPLIDILFIVFIATASLQLNVYSRANRYAHCTKCTVLFSH